MTFEDRFCSIALERNHLIADYIRVLAVHYSDYETRNYVKGALWMWEEMHQKAEFQDSYLRSLLKDLYDRTGLDKVP